MMELLFDDWSVDSDERPRRKENYFFVGDRSFLRWAAVRTIIIISSKRGLIRKKETASFALNMMTGSNVSRQTAQRKDRWTVEEIVNGHPKIVIK